MHCPGGLLYAVRRGETLTSIARKFGVTVREIVRANPSIDPDRLDIGQVICIPAVADEVCPDGKLYTVRRTDSMFRIARSFSIPLATLIAANPQVPDPDLIYPGEQLCIPPKVAPPPDDCPGGLLYAVRRGETLTSIARKFGVTVREIVRANPSIDPDRLDIGQVICIPKVADEVCPDGKLYTVRPTDSMFTIARSFSIPLATLIAANPQVPDPDLIYPGEQLCIPPKVAPPPDDCPGGLLYAVRRGETLFSIARKFGVTVREIEKANPGIDPDRLDIGQVICIPKVADEVCPDGKLYTVRRTDSMFSIARKFSRPLDALIAANPQVPDPDLIYPGEQLCIPPRHKPTQPVRCPGGIIYAVRRGETLFSIARKFGLTVRELERANPDIDPDRLQIGQLICIPGVADELCHDGRLYIVQRTDSMFTIGREFGVSLDLLIRINFWIPDPALIYPGEYLCIPRR